MLALNRFRKSFAAAQAIVMSTYVLAQLCIGMAVAR